MSGDLKGRKITGEMTEIALMHLISEMEKGELLRFEYVDVMIASEKNSLFGIDTNYRDKFSDFLDEN